MRAVRSGALVVAALCGALRAAAADECTTQFDSTFAAVQELIFAGHGCTSVTCHVGPAPAGGLDLSPDVAWDNLIDVPPQSVSVDQHPGLARVVPGNKKRSLLWLNLAAATLPSLWQAPLNPMPLGGLPPLSSDELELIQLWLENGATRDGVVPGTAGLIDACLPPPEPLKVEPLPPPPPGLGAQLRAPRQALPPQTERETCFVSHYDVTDQVPAEFRGPDGTTFRYKRIDARQDPLSHHAVVFVYQGPTPIDDPVWGPFTCQGGQRDGQPCAPKERDACGADAICSSPPRQSVACIGFGPGDASIGTGETSLFNSMGGAVGDTVGVFDEAPLQGTLVWNSHAFNVTDTPATLDMWVNFEFAPPAEQQRPLERFVDVSAIGRMSVPAFGVQEICHHYTLPPNVRVLDLTAHTHKRGRRFRVFEGDFACQAGPHQGAPCSPMPADPGLPVPDLCAGAPCVSARPVRAGDCDGDRSVSIDDLIAAVTVALNRAPVAACQDADADGSGTVNVHELIMAVGDALASAWRDADDSLIYTNLTYGDPLILSFSPPRVFGRHQSRASERTLTYCALYDNGFTDPADVKRNSLVPSNAGPCKPTHCAEGDVGAPCASDAECDSSPGTGDGRCDACTVGFGISTDDEMFVLIGSYIQE